MTVAVVYSRANSGIDAPAVTVEAHVSGGLPRFSIVGLPETVVKESKDRVRSAILDANFTFPATRITVNLAPAELPKQGGRFDLPIALSILAASRQIPMDQLDQYEFAGELALSGHVRPIQGALPFALAAAGQHRTLVLPAENMEEAAIVQNIELLPARHLLEVCQHFCSPGQVDKQLRPYQHSSTPANLNYEQDLGDVQGQHQARRALEIAAAGSHSLLMSGPPGSGKTMLASRLPSILPPLSRQEALKTAAVQSILGKKIDPYRWQQRPFRAPHHTASAPALVGGGNPPTPGEISLAHNGILFLDELPEYSRRVLETLREPMESGHIIISRAGWQTYFPAKFQLIAAMNPCPCGYHGSNIQSCRCSHEQIMRYKNRLSGPLLDRIDLHIEVAPLALQDYKNKKSQQENSLTVRQRVIQAREMQHHRQKKYNAELNVAEIEQYCHLPAAEEQLLLEAIQKLGLSMRSYHKILKVARTLADLAETQQITRVQLLEALSYRKIERNVG